MKTRTAVFEKRRCIRCGAKAVMPRTGAGRTTSYRTMPCMPIPEDLLIPACGRCQSEYLDEETVSYTHLTLPTSDLV